MPPGTRPFLICAGYSRDFPVSAIPQHLPKIEPRLWANIIWQHAIGGENIGTLIGRELADPVDPHEILQDFAHGLHLLGCELRDCFSYQGQTCSVS
jgi:hypothetical protein